MQSKVFFHTAYVALGSNLGDKEANLRRALELLIERGVEIVKTSTFISTEPYGVTDQPTFLNGVCEVRTSLEPLALLHTLLEIEQEMGRVRLRHWGERNIDLDLLLYDAGLRGLCGRGRRGNRNIRWQNLMLSVRAGRR